MNINQNNLKILQAERLERAIKERGISAAQLSRESDIAESTISRIKRRKGKSSMNEYTAQKLAKVLDCRYQYLLGYDEYFTSDEIAERMTVTEKAAEYLRKESDDYFINCLQTYGYEIFDAEIPREFTRNHFVLLSKNRIYDVCKDGATIFKMSGSDLLKISDTFKKAAASLAVALLDSAAPVPNPGSGPP